MIEKLLKELMRKVEAGDTSLNATHLVNEVDYEIKTYVAETTRQGALFDTGSPQYSVGKPILDKCIERIL